MANDELLKGDAVFDQMHAEIRNAVREDIAGWAEFSRRINDAADTREKCATAEFTREERYKIMRLADLASHFITARLLGRDVTLPHLGRQRQQNTKQERQMGMKTFNFEVTAKVSVTLDESLVPDEDYRRNFYQFHTLEDVAGHFAYNAVANGVFDISRLDGHADRKKEDAKIEVDWAEVERA